MNAKYKVALAMVGSFALGAIAVQSLHAQGKPPAYFIAEVNVSDPDGFQKEFLPIARKHLAEAGAKYLASGGAAASAPITSLRGAPASRVVIIRFESIDKVKAWYELVGKADEQAGSKYATWVNSFALEGAMP